MQILVEEEENNWETEVLFPNFRFFKKESFVALCVDPVMTNDGASECTEAQITDLLPPTTTTTRRGGRGQKQTFKRHTRTDTPNS